MENHLKLTIVVPCYNEEEVIVEATHQFSLLLNKLIDSGKISNQSRITYVDDGSKDKTWSLINSLSESNKLVTGLKLSRNRGHQNAVLAGMMTVSGDAIITIDADLQDDINVIEKMVDEYNNGVDIVYGVRNDRKTDTLFKRNTAQLYYKLLAMFGVDMIYNHADFRLMSRRTIESLRQYSEVNLYLRGIIPLIGFKSTCIEYSRKERFAGSSKYPFKKMLKLAIEGVTSFSVVPLQMITYIGFIVFIASFGILTWVLSVALFTNQAVPGWASTVLPIYFLGGIQILCLGVMGSYLGKIYIESKSRPRYFIENKVGQNAIQDNQEQPARQNISV
jgi:polyisoprenyl-phosphate glycosyltransferase